MTNPPAERGTEMVFFDAGETLVHPEPSFPQLFKQVCASHGLEVDLSLLPAATRCLMAGVEERQKEGYTFTNDAEESRRFWLDFYSRLVRELGGEEADGDLPLHLYRTFSDPANYTAYHDVPETLARLREEGYRLGIISNFEAWLQDLLDDLDLSRHFEVMVISGRERYEKPHPEIYALALRRAGVHARRALHVGDSPLSDYRGPREAGMRAVLLDRWGRFPDFGGERVRDLRELPELLARGDL
ncbi:MAG: HAD-IA family hydrolase [Actinobacteria bacterium]|nr:HAD-IA family hydrolase [Actinomycetota bacterium]